MLGQCHIPEFLLQFVFSLWVFISKVGSLIDVFVMSHTCIECSLLNSQGFVYKPSGCEFDFP